MYCEELGSSFTPSSQALAQAGDITWALSSPGERDNPSSPKFSLSVRYSSHFTTFVALNWIHSRVPISVLGWGAQSWTQCSSCVSGGLSRGEECPPSACWQCSFSADQGTVGFLCCRGPWWLMTRCCSLQGCLQLLSPQSVLLDRAVLPM